MRTRRQFLTDTALASGAALITAKAAEAAAQAAAPTNAPGPSHAGHSAHEAAPAAPTVTAPPRVLSLAGTNMDGARMTTPNGVSLTGKLVNGVRVFHLIASGIEHEFTPGLHAKCWGYNGRTPGPTLEATQGERIRIYMENRLPEPTATHWHGLILPNGMDGVAGLTQRYIQPGETFMYEFDLKHAGTFMYHPHLDEMTQMGMGLSGMFIVHPKNAKAKAAVDRDFAIMLGEWHVPVGGSRPDPREMVDFMCHAIVKRTGTPSSSCSRLFSPILSPKFASADL